MSNYSFSLKPNIKLQEATSMEALNNLHSQLLKNFEFSAKSQRLTKAKQKILKPYT